MFYKKNTEKSLSPELFKNPTSEYRGTPFWAWNCELDKEELLRQIDIFKEMGLGGFHMHVRTGLSTPYLGEEYMGFINACVDKARENDMLAYLYDEDRWPSGSAGGIVTQNDEYRQRLLRFTTVPYKKERKNDIFFVENTTVRTEEGILLTVFDIELDDKGYLKEYRQIQPEDEVKGTKWYVYMDYSPKTSWFNNQSYVDTMNKEAMDRFIEVTYEAYNKNCSKDFGGVIPSIFTDEPQVAHKERLNSSFDTCDVTLPWTPTFPDTYKAKYSEDIMEHLPELFWNLPDNKPSVTRYRYHDHVADRFSEAFGQNCGQWCDEHGIALTGHLMCEQTLYVQTLAVSEAMRNYRGFGIPGIDMLCAAHEFITAKQCQSAVHQFGSEAMLSELYGVTGWDFDFRGHKLHGDWQAALGVTIRVQHLSWVSMKGESKRDYPASISYQSPWYGEYRRIEDHFARVNTALTRGKPIINVGVIHPVESYWLFWGPVDVNAPIANEIDSKFLQLADWLVKINTDFNFICEATLPELCENPTAPLTVGKMAYDVIVVPECLTLRSTTLEALEKFKATGGKLIFMGKEPAFENAVPSNRGKKLFADSISIEYSRDALQKALEDSMYVTIRYADGSDTNRFCHQLRQDGDVKWLFVAQAINPPDKNQIRGDDIDITIKGKYSIRLFDTQTGEIYAVSCTYKEGNTVFSREIHNYDSLLLELTEISDEKESGSIKTEEDAKTPALSSVCVKNEVEYTLSEPNCLLLDMAEYKLDDGKWQPEEEILRLDAKLCGEIGLPARGGHVAQPWVIGRTPDEHTVSLRFTINSEIDVQNVLFASERITEGSLAVNGNKVDIAVCGWYVDKSIETVKIPDLKKGMNIIELTLPFGVEFNTEWCYLLGDFGVEVSGRASKLIKKPEKVSFSDLTEQGFPFYGGNITYHLPICSKTGKIRLTVSDYVGALITLNNGQEIIYPPYNAWADVPVGDSILDITLFGNRQNSFGHVHYADRSLEWIGPYAWRSEGDQWSYDYVLRKLGIICVPVVEE